jgi:hypothetical protein
MPPRGRPPEGHPLHRSRGPAQLPALTLPPLFVFVVRWVNPLRLQHQLPRPPLVAHCDRTGRRTGSPAPGPRTADSCYPSSTSRRPSPKNRRGIRHHHVTPRCLTDRLRIGSRGWTSQGPASRAVNFVIPAQGGNPGRSGSPPEPALDPIGGGDDLNQRFLADVWTGPCGAALPCPKTARQRAGTAG